MCRRHLRWVERNRLPRTESGAEVCAPIGLTAEAVGDEVRDQRLAHPALTRPHASAGGHLRGAHIAAVDLDARPEPLEWHILTPTHDGAVICELVQTRQDREGSEHGVRGPALATAPPPGRSDVALPTTPQAERTRDRETDPDRAAKSPLLFETRFNKLVVILKVSLTSSLYF